MLASGSMNINVALCATVMSISIVVCHECYKALIYKLGHQRSYPKGSINTAST